MPGLLLCFVLRYDAYKRNQPTSDVGVPTPPSVYQKLTYFHCSLIGYFLGKLQHALCSSFELFEKTVLFIGRMLQGEIANLHVTDGNCVVGSK